MRELFTIDNFMVAFVAALGYGFSKTIAMLFGWPEPVCIGASLAIGIAVEWIVNKIAFSETVQRKPANRVITYAVFFAIFLIGHAISVKWMGASMLEYLEEQFRSVVGLPILGFVINMLIRAYRIHKIRERYGDGNEGYVLDAEQEDIEELNKQNQPVVGEHDSDRSVKTRTGVYVGEEKNGVISYLGIPYAKPPVGELRWMPPEPLAPSQAMFEAKNFGASAMQVEHAGSSLKHHRQSEDCLTLNIWVADDEDEAKKPVLVLFHHGDFSYGGSADPLLCGEGFASEHQGIVVASFNYRIGAFGFIDFSEVPGGQARPDASNLGLLDQIAALEWIRENIAAFGGDPNRITVAGFESGATSISLLAACEQAKGLFQRAFVFYGSPEAAHDTPKAAKALAKNLLAETKATTMGELLQVPAETLKAATQGLGLNACAPTCDGTLVPADVYGAYQNGAASGIEFVIGFPSNEGRVFRSFVGNRDYEDYVSRRAADIQDGVDDLVADALREYVDAQAACSSEAEAKARLVELWNDLCIYRTAAKLSAGGNAVHLMYWDEKPLIENLSSGTVDVAAALLGNDDALQMYGSVMDANLSEILQAFLQKLVNGEALELYSNEIRGFEAFDWKAFPQALIISDGEIRLGEFRSAELLYLLAQEKRS